MLFRQTHSFCRNLNAEAVLRYHQSRFAPKKTANMRDWNGRCRVETNEAPVGGNSRLFARLATSGLYRRFAKLPAACDALPVCRISPKKKAVLILEASRAEVRENQDLERRARYGGLVFQLTVACDCWSIPGLSLAVNADRVDADRRPTSHAGRRCQPGSRCCAAGGNTG